MAKAEEQFHGLDSPRNAPDGCIGRMSHRRKKIVGILLLVVGIFLIVIGILFGAVVPGFLNRKILGAAQTESMEQAKASESFFEPHNDCDTCVPYYVSYYPFTILNAQEIMDKNAKPQVQEKGPYVYRKYAVLVDVSFEEEWIKYKTLNTFTYEPEKSCPGCSQDDEIISYDTGYLATMSGAGGEEAFMDQLIEGLLTKRGLGDKIAAFKLIPNLKQHFLRALSGLNSNDGRSILEALEVIGPVLTLDLSKYDTPKEKSDAVQNALKPVLEFTADNIKGDKIHFSGIFAKRNVKQMAYGYPSLLAGLGVTAKLPQCMQTGDCANCNPLNPSDECKKNWAFCGLCAKGQKVFELSNEYICEKFKLDLLEQPGMDINEAEIIVQSTCKKCPEGLFCLAPLPGAVDATGLTSFKDLNPGEARFFEHHTGKGDSSKVNELRVAEGINSAAVWRPMKHRRNPTTREMQAFGNDAYCDGKESEKKRNVYCIPVKGSDGTGFPAGGATISGLRTETANPKVNVYVPQAMRGIDFYVSPEERYELKGIELERFRPRGDALNYNKSMPQEGRGVPVNGVGNLGYARGFLAFLSFPFFVQGDLSLIEKVELFFEDGTPATKETLYNSDGSLRKKWLDKYSTYLDIDPISGKPFNARKRLQASFALARKPKGVTPPENVADVVPGDVILDLMFPEMEAEVIMPIFWVEERATITDHLAELFTSKMGLPKTLGTLSIPMLIIGLVGGLICLGVAVWILVVRRRQYKMAQHNPEFDL